MFNGFFNSETKTIRGATAILAISALISAVLGLWRDRLLAGFFGAGPETSIYFAAFRIPDLIYKVLILGGVLVAFLPIFAEYFAENKEKAWQMTNYVLNVFLFLLVLTSLTLFIITPWLIKFIIPGLVQEYRVEAISLTRLLFLSPIFFGISNIFSGVLHYFNRFLVYSLAPVIYNLGIISGILFLFPYFGIMGAGIGVILGAFLHFLVQMPSVFNCGYRYRFVFSFRQPAIKRIFTLMLPRVFSVAANQINLIIMTAFASLVSMGSIAIFSFAQNLQGLPTTIMGSSLATAVFPTFSRYLANGQKREFVKTFSDILAKGLFLTIPISVIFFLLREQIVRLILGTGRFTVIDGQLTAVSLGFFAVSIFALSLLPYLARAFFSLQDTKTPAIITLVSVAINIALSFLLIRALSFQNSFKSFIETVFNLGDAQGIAVIGLPLAFSISTVCQFFILLFFLSRKIGDHQMTQIWHSFWRIILASILMGLAVYFFNSQNFLGLFWQTIIAISVGILVYIASAVFFKSPEMKNLWKK